MIASVASLFTAVHFQMTSHKQAEILNLNSDKADFQRRSIPVGYHDGKSIASARSSYTVPLDRRTTNRAITLLQERQHLQLQKVAATFKLV